MKKIIAITIIIANIGSAMFAQTARVYFDFNSDKISTNYSNQIKALVSGNDLPIEIFAYTDTVGNVAYNLNLGKRRVESVTNCIKQFNNKIVIKASNYGESKSSLPADSLNRRVDIFIKQKIKPTVTIAPKETQEFVIDNSKDTTIIGNEGTKIFIPANSLVLANGQKPGNSIYKIQLQEYYKLSDMLMARLSTTTNGQLLTTGGMLNLKITNNNQEGGIVPQKGIGIAFKNKTAKDSMQLYSGSRKQNVLDWNLSEQTSPPEEEEVFVVVEESATFRGGDVNSFRNYIQSELKNDQSNSTSNLAKVIVQFAINNRGEMEDVIIARGVRPSIDYCVMNAIKNSPEWSPARQGGKSVKQQFTIPIIIDLNSKIDSGIKNDSSLVCYVYKRNTNNSSLARYYNKRNANDSFLNTNKTGWLNCDKIIRIKYRTQFMVELNMNMDAPCLIFKRFKAILPAYFKEDNATAYLFNDVPDNERVTVFSLKIENNEFFLAYNSTNTRLKKIKLDFKKVDAAELKRVLDDLDKL